MKKKNTITKHDLRRSIKSIYQQLSFVTERLRVTETLFNDFIEIQKECKFNNCLHLEEPDCKIKDNVGKKIWSKRYSSYLSIINELN